MVVYKEGQRIWRNAVQLSESDPPTVGASLLAMVVNDYACLLAKRGALESIASKLAPTVSSALSMRSWKYVDLIVSYQQTFVLLCTSNRSV
ncbi:hypothetical protein AN403_6004 [Pseudomonas fluorescens]|uniref:Uncharacterized protein n=1 Tax=Pseudomonas fluorescens TaxID=294 RepID=A0A0P8X744_PSEFL|nr:hypothetical protein AN403_6004 [Pseudomonas fluorescens]